MKAPLTINPPLLNSANPWATNLEDLKALYECPYTGAVTTRTSLLEGFPHDDTIHQYTFFDPASHRSIRDLDNKGEATLQTASLNTLGYSPIPLREYLGFITSISKCIKGEQETSKPVIISVTGTPDEIVQCYRSIRAHQGTIAIPLAMEINLSCPNIPDKPPPAYSAASLSPYLALLVPEVSAQDAKPVPIGLKLPPYTYAGQFTELMTALLSTQPEKCPVSFLTATNTLGTSLLLSPSPDEAHHYTPTLAPAVPHHSSIQVDNITGLGGMAGTALHPLALGNVYSLRRHLFRHAELENIQIIGVGGVEDADGFKRMRAVGAAAVGVGTALGRKGIAVFQEIIEGAGIAINRG